MRKCSIVIAGASLILQGCATSKTTNIEARVVWGDSIRHMGINAFYPPRADVKVGDVFLYITSTCSASNADAAFNRTLFLGHLDPQVIARLNQNTYGWRQDLPSLKAEKASDTGSGRNSGDADKTETAKATPKTKAEAARKAATAAKADADKKAEAAAKASAAVKTTPPAQVAAAKARAALAAKRAKAAKTLATAKAKAAADAEAAASKVSPDAAGAAPSAAAADESIDVKMADGNSVSISSGKRGSSDAADKKTGASQKATDSSSSITKVPVADKADPIFAVDADGIITKKPRAYSHLMQAAFPAVALGSYSKAGFDANVPVSGIGKIFAGASREADSEVRVSASNIVEDQLPISDVYQAAIDFLKSPTGDKISHGRILNLIVRNAEEELKNQAGDECGQLDLKQPQFIFVSQVYYAYSLDFEVTNKLGYAAALRAEMAAAQATNATSANSSPATAITPSGSYIPAELKPSADLGGGLHYEIGETGSVILKQTFEEPLAFGYESAVKFYSGDIKTVLAPPKPPAPLKAANVARLGKTAPLLTLASETFLRPVLFDAGGAADTAKPAEPAGNDQAKNCTPPDDIDAPDFLTKCRDKGTPDPKHGGGTMRVEEPLAQPEPPQRHPR